MAHYSSH